MGFWVFSVLWWSYLYSMLDDYDNLADPQIKYDSDLWPEYYTA